MLKELFPSIDTTPASSEVGRVLQLTKAYGFGHWRFAVAQGPGAIRDLILCAYLGLNGTMDAPLVREEK